MLTFIIKWPLCWWKMRGEKNLSSYSTPISLGFSSFLWYHKLSGHVILLSGMNHYFASCSGCLNHRHTIFSLQYHSQLQLQAIERWTWFLKMFNLEPWFNAEPVLQSVTQSPCVYLGFLWSFGFLPLPPKKSGLAMLYVCMSGCGDLWWTGIPFMVNSPTLHSGFLGEAPVLPSCPNE